MPERAFDRSAIAFALSSRHASTGKDRTPAADKDDQKAPHRYIRHATACALRRGGWARDVSDKSANKRQAGGSWRQPGVKERSMRVTGSAGGGRPRLTRGRTGLGSGRRSRVEITGNHFGGRALRLWHERSPEEIRDWAGHEDLAEVRGRQKLTNRSVQGIAVKFENDAFGALEHLTRPEDDVALSSLGIDLQEIDPTRLVAKDVIEWPDNYSRPTFVISVAT